MPPKMAASLLLKSAPLFRLRVQHHRLAVGVLSQLRRPWCATSESSLVDENGSSMEKTITASTGIRPPARHRSWDDPDYRKWKDKEEEILKDVEPIISLAKDILHSNRYMDGECLTAEDEEVVIEKLLRHHPNSEDKIGCGLDFIMVDRHPQFRQSRCMFVVRTDGGWIDFSYQKCLRAYIRDKYPSHAERFIREHFKRSS